MIQLNMIQEGFEKIKMQLAASNKNVLISFKS